MVERGAVGEDKRAVRTQMRAIRACDRRRRRRPSAALGVDLPVRSSTASAERMPRHVLPLRRAARASPISPSLAAWCADNDVAIYRPVVDGDALVVVPGDVDPGSSTSSSSRAWRSPVTGERLGQGGGHFDRFLTASAATVCASAWRSTSSSSTSCRPSDTTSPSIASSPTDPPVWRRAASRVLVQMFRTCYITAAEYRNGDLTSSLAARY